MQGHELVARCAAAVETADPMDAARKVLEDLRGEIHGIEKMLAVAALHMSAIDPKQAPLAAPHMCAFGANTAVGGRTARTREG
jgi:hypothetical protein